MVKKITSVLGGFTLFLVALMVSVIKTNKRNPPQELTPAQPPSQKTLKE